MCYQVHIWGIFREAILSKKRDFLELVLWGHHFMFYEVTISGNLLKSIFIKDGFPLIIGVFWGLSSGGGWHWTCICLSLSDFVCLCLTLSVFGWYFGVEHLVSCGGCARQGAIISGRVIRCLAMLPFCKHQHPHHFHCILRICRSQFVKSWFGLVCSSPPILFDNPV